MDVVNFLRTRCGTKSKNKKQCVFCFIMKSCICSGIFGIMGIATIMVPILMVQLPDLTFERNFLLSYISSVLITGFIFVPFFIKSRGQKELQFGQSILGGILSVLIAVLIGLVLFAILSFGLPSFYNELGDVIRKSIFVPFSAGLFIGSVVFPMSVLGAIFSQIAWWKIKN